MYARAEHDAKAQLKVGPEEFPSGESEIEAGRSTMSALEIITHPTMTIGDQITKKRVTRKPSTPAAIKPLL